MLMTFEATSALINDGKLLHIAGTEALLRKLPKGNWIGGSTEYFMANEGGKVSGELLFVTKFPYEDFKIKVYGAEDIHNVAADAADNGFSIVIVPFNSAVHSIYAENAASYEDMFLKNITGWVSGLNLGIAGQTPIAVNGLTATAYADKASVLHITVPAGKTVGMGIINIFSQDESSPVIEFAENDNGSFSVEKWHKFFPNYAKVYSGVYIDSKLLTVLRRSDRKMKYMEYDLKVEQRFTLRQCVLRSLQCTADAYD